MPVAIYVVKAPTYCYCVIPTLSGWNIWNVLEFIIYYIHTAECVLNCKTNHLSTNTPNYY